MKLQIQSTVELPIQSPPDEVWLRPGTQAERGRGTGSAWDPLPVATADDFDQVFRERYGRPTTFRLWPGTYFTRGCWAFPGQNYTHFGPGSALIGSGSRRTFIALTQAPVLRTEGQPRPDTSVLWLGKPYDPEAWDIHLEGVTLDGRQAHLSQAAEGGGPVYPDGVRIFASRAVVRDVHVRGLRGAYPGSLPGGRDYEAFGINLHATGDLAGGSLLENCVVSGCATGSYVNAFSIGYTHLQPVMRTHVVRCHARLGRDNHAAFTVNREVTLRDCTASGVRYGIYNDTDMVDDLLASGCHIETHYAGVYLVAMQPQHYKRGIRVTDSLFTYQPISQAPCIGVALLDNALAGAPIEQVVVEGCTFRVPEDRRFALASTKANALKNLRIERCTIPKSAAVHLAGPAKACTTQNNWHPDGSPAAQVLPAYAAV